MFFVVTTLGWINKTTADYQIAEKKFLLDHKVYTMSEIPLTKGKFAIVDDEDFEELSKYTWQCSTIGYATRTKYKGLKNGKEVSDGFLMHRQIMGAKKGQIVDHINRNKLDNRKENLRFVTKAQNSWNNDAKIGKSGYKGVWRCNTKHKERWFAIVTLNRKRYSAGSHDTPEQAYEAWKKKALELRGELVGIN